MDGRTGSGFANQHASQPADAADGAGTSQALRASSPSRGAKGMASAEGNDLYSTALEDYRTRNNLALRMPWTAGATS